MVRVLHGVLHEPHRRRLLLAKRFFQSFGHCTQIVVVLGRCNIVAHRFEICLDGCPALLRELPAAQIHRLHAVGAFVDLGDPGVAHELAHAPFLDIAVATEDLLHVGRNLIALVGAISLDDRGQQTDHRIGFGAFLFGLRLVGQVDEQRPPQRQGAHAFGEGLGIHQHTANVRVDEYRVGLGFRLGGTGQCPALTPVESVGDSVLICDFSLAETLHTDAEAGCVHHDEHCSQALVLFTDKPSRGAVVIEDASGIGVNTHLVFDRTAHHAIAFANRTVLVHQELRHHEQRDTLGAVRRSRGLRQNQMDDVVRKVMLAGRNEDLGAGNRVAAIALRLRLGADHAEIGAALRFGQVHGAGPFAGHHLGQIHFLLFLSALGDQCRNGAIGQARIHAECLVGAGNEFFHHEAEHMRQALSAKLLGLRQRPPSRFAKLVEGFLETFRSGDGTVLVTRTAFLIARLVYGRQYLGTELAAFGDHGIGYIGARHFEARQVAVAGKIEQFIDKEAGVAGRRGICGHLRVLGLSLAGMAPGGEINRGRVFRYVR